MLSKTSATRIWNSVFVLIVLLAEAGTAQITKNITVLGTYQRPGTARSVAGIWGWTAENGKEFALMTSQEPGGLSVVDISTPSAPKLNAFFPAGHSSVWFETHSYKNYAYLVSQEGTIGLMIIDMSPLQTGGTAKVVSNFTTEFRNAHTLYVDTTVSPARMYVTFNGVAGVKILSLANPASPTLLGRVDGETHDMYARGNLLFINGQYRGVLEIWNVANPASPTRITSISLKNKSIELGEIPAGGTTIVHNCWLSDDSKTLYSTEEVIKTTTKVWDISTPASPRYLGKYLGDPNVICHNVYIKGNKMYAAHYTAGMRIVDVSNPALPKDVAWHRPSTSTAEYGGTWGVYPFFNSGNIIFGDEDLGLFVVRDDSPSSLAERHAAQGRFHLAGIREGSVEFRLPGIGAYALSIYSSAGREILNHRSGSAVGPQSLALNHGLAGGNYLVKATQGGQVFRGSLAIPR